MIILRDKSFKYHKDGSSEVVYEIANEDLSADPQYFGYLNHTGAWVIQKRVISTGAYSYCAGVSSYAASWTARASLTYVAFNAL